MLAVIHSTKLLTNFGVTYRERGYQWTFLVHIICHHIQRVPYDRGNKDIGQEHHNIIEQLQSPPELNSLYVTISGGIRERGCCLGEGTKISR